MFYEIMHRESCVAQLSTTGECRVCLEDFMPCDLVLVESDDFDERINNVTNFYYWCASRMLTLDRTYAKEILNSIGASQSVTDRERAQIALSYHCLSLLDVFWVKEENEKIRFEDINLFAHSLSNALVDIALRGHQQPLLLQFLKKPVEQFLLIDYIQSRNGRRKKSDQIKGVLRIRPAKQPQNIMHNVQFLFILGF